jgi:hypothetical protein
VTGFSCERTVSEIEWAARYIHWFMSTNEYGTYTSQYENYILNDDENTAGTFANYVKLLHTYWGYNYKMSYISSDDNVNITAFPTP